MALIGRINKMKRGLKILRTPPSTARGGLPVRSKAGSGGIAFNDVPNRKQGLR